MGGQYTYDRYDNAPDIFLRGAQLNFGPTRYRHPSSLRVLLGRITSGGREITILTFPPLGRIRLSLGRVLTSRTSDLKIYDASYSFLPFLM